MRPHGHSNRGTTRPIHSSIRASCRARCGMPVRTRQDTTTCVARASCDMTRERGAKRAAPTPVRGMAATLFRSIARISALQHGRISHAQLLRAGVGRERIKRWHADGRLELVCVGVYAVGHTAPSLLADLWTARLAGGEGAVVSHRSAGHLLQLVRDPPPIVEITVGAPRRDGRAAELPLPCQPPCLRGGRRAPAAVEPHRVHVGRAPRPGARTHAQLACRPR